MKTIEETGGRKPYFLMMDLQPNRECRVIHQRSSREGKKEEINHAAQNAQHVSFRVLENYSYFVLLLFI
jgi:hypothetical protein